MLIAILFVNFTVSALYLILYIVLHNVLHKPLYIGVSLLVFVLDTVYNKNEEDNLIE